ncbi:unnamed protein product [Protopolystoma xenopodis]|uniref:Uncharacterized protein n=1 Tax=Protopolystoma xenopodis TaxID=117903 RepID=A0A3S5BWJ0_9PLAT|nr:unnamed protein product [Protopolystoma xenopodis]
MIPLAGKTHQIVLFFHLPGLGPNILKYSNRLTLQRSPQLSHGK